MPTAPPKPDPRTEAAPERCAFCRKPIERGQRRVDLSRGVAHLDCNREKVAAGIAEALAAGTHTTAPMMHVCADCRDWQVMYHRRLDGQMVCRECWWKTLTDAEKEQIQGK